MPLILSAFGPRLDLDAVLDRVDGVVATGSKSNVHPSHYGVTATEAMGPYDEVRDATVITIPGASHGVVHDRYRELTDELLALAGIGTA